MAAFPENSILQLSAFHALVVLLRPLGGNGGGPALLSPDPSSSPSSSSSRRAGGGGGGPRWEENGVRVMLGTLRRYSSDRYLQAMGCWAMVNAALYPALKTSLLRLGGVYAVTNAMMLHPDAEAVQFRGLFALINLVIPGE